jgi:hypothetical protein
MGVGGETEAAHEGEDAPMSGRDTSGTDLVAVGSRRDDSTTEAIFFE